MVAQRQAGDDAELADVSPDDIRDSQPPQGGATPAAVPAEEDAPVAPVERLLDARAAVQRAAADAVPVVQRNGTACPPYAGYSSDVAVESYNCAGLAHRTYSFMSLPATLTALSGGAQTQGACPVGQVKHWLWRYDLHAESSEGRRTPASADFHTVAGAVSQQGVEPADVYSKNGRRAIHGPGTGASFRPAAREQLRTNDPSERPVTGRSGQPVYAVRENYTDTTYCLPCPSQNPPKAGPPPPPAPGGPSQIDL
jgi:hypothetical protein